MSIKDMINNIMAGENDAAKEEFNTLMNEKVMSVIDDMRINIAQEIFNEGKSPFQKGKEEAEDDEESEDDVDKDDEDKDSDNDVNLTGESGVDKDDADTDKADDDSDDKDSDADVSKKTKNGKKITVTVED